MKSNRLFALVGASVLALTLAACGSGGGSDSGTTSAPSPTETSASENAVKKIAFFGFWKTNSFTQAVLEGVEEGAAQIGAEVIDLSPADYDAAAQIKAVQDQTVKGDAQLYVMLASDSVGMATAAKEAIDAGITVVAAFTPLGPDFTTLDPQVEDLIVVAETPVSNGEVLGQLALDACGDLNPCNIAYLEGFKALPLDNARTQAFVDTVSTNPNARIVAQIEGGYTPDSGTKAAQDALQAAPEINVMVGSSQAILGAQTVVDTAAVKLIGNGSSCEAFEAVTAGDWYALYNSDIVGIGVQSVVIGSEAANGQNPNPVFNIQDLRDPKGTADIIANFTCAYSDLG